MSTPHQPGPATAPESTRTQRVWFAVAALLAVYAILAWLQRAPSITAANDDAEYLLLGHALAQGSYRNLYVVGHPFQAQYPPGFPALLAALGSVFGFRLWLFQAVNISCVILSLGLLFDVVRHRWSERFALVLLALLVINPSLVSRGGLLMSEAPYMALAMVPLWVTVRRPASGKWLAVAAVAAVAASLTRSIGVTLIAAMLLYLLLERRWRGALGLLTLALVTVGSWIGWTMQLPGSTGRSYVADSVAGYETSGGLLGTILTRLTTNVPQYLIRGIPFHLPVFTIPGTPIDNIMWVSVVTVLGLVGVTVIWLRWRVAALYLVSYLGLVAIWAWTLSRYLIPIVPLIVLAVLAGANEVRTRWWPRGGLALAGVVVALIALQSLRENAPRTRIALGCGRSAPLVDPACFNPDQMALFAGAKYAAGSLPGSAAILAAKGATFSYYSDREVLYVDDTPVGSPDLLDLVRAKGVYYVFLGRNFGTEWAAMAHNLLQHCGRLKLVRSFPPHSHLFQVLPTVAKDPSSPACAALADYVAFDSDVAAEPPLWW